MELGKASVVYSKKGHDVGRAYVVVSIDEVKGYAIIADGKIRPLSKPKTKNLKHLRYVGEVCEEALEKISNGTLKDSDLICYLKRYNRED